MDASNLNFPADHYDRCQINGFNLLEELALNLRWSWNHKSDIIWETLDANLWELTHNPWIVLQTTSRERLEKILCNEKFCSLVRSLLTSNHEDQTREAWFQKTYPNSPLNHIVYFSMEYMLSEALPIYSGGLGNVAGDQLKAASDLGVPVTAIGLLYQQGYFRQILDNQGAQQALYPYNDPGQLPIVPLRKADGEWLRLEVVLPGYSVWIRTWQVNVGRVKLYLLDTNDAANYPAYRGITSELYGGDNELRLKQEIVLGIGGWRLLEALGISPEVCHLNEGHAAFAIMERAFCLMKKHNLPFETALKTTRIGNLFTTHTAVSAGFDLFPPSLIEKYLGNFIQNRLKISMKSFLALGRQNPDDDDELFNMAYLALRGSGFSNGVSALHAQVSKHLFAPLFPRWPENEIPIGHVTNGIHVPSWESKSSDALWTDACGKERWLQDTKILGHEIDSISDEELWKMRQVRSQEIVSFIRKRTALQLAVSGASQEEINAASTLFDPNTLTLGFARRFATYKRPNLLLHDRERFLKILTNSKYPVQIFLAGKAHPADKPGQALIKEWSDFIKNTKAHPHVVYLSDYDMYLTAKLVHGVDVWINTPRRPWEACGTSGMKILVNGGLNLSVLDGWWAEAYTPQVGWAITHSTEPMSEAEEDARDAEALYSILENDVIPSFYTRDSRGISSAWVGKMRNSMAKLTPLFSTNRSVREYTEKYYIPSAKLFMSRTQEHTLASKQKTLAEQWSSLKFGEMKVEPHGNNYSFKVELTLHEMDPQSIRVELFANGNEQFPPLQYVMKDEGEINASSHTHCYTVDVPATLPANNYTPRVVPNLASTTPLEMPQILWEH